ncbi:MAG: ABC transporter ATP-binding protein [Planctomycetota bacterium]|jgi:ABC-2 type transport system ATP-binding protein|nr:ABC transporter ATP-binding protein [Planctomycetota bacterium]
MTDEIPAIRTGALAHSYQRNFWERKRLALDGLNLIVERGEIYGFLGANGAGKTTTIKILVGLQTQTAGTAEIFGIPVADGECRRRIGFMPENPYFYEYLTARESLDFYGALCDLPAAERRRRNDELLGFVGLSQAADTRLKEFSKGMRQRLGIAQAIVHRPPLVILDEPMSGLDPVGRRQVRQAILDLHAGGATIFFSSHILSDIEMICHRAALIDKGKLLASGTLEELLDTRELEIEVGGTGLDAERSASVAARAKRSLRRNGETLLSFDNWDAAYFAADMFREHGRLTLLRTVKESLEDYFMRSTGRIVAETRTGGE